MRSIVPDDFWWEWRQRRCEEVRRALSEKYQRQLETADPEARKKLRETMDKEIQDVTAAYLKPQGFWSFLRILH
jgi:hypothetical protein